MNLEESLQEFIMARHDIAIKRAMKNQEYRKIVIARKNKEETVENILSSLEEHEKALIKHYYEGNHDILAIEHDEIYIQGFKDAFNLFMNLT